MNWDAVGAVAEITGAIAVLITLLYLAKQIKQSNLQDLLAADQHMQDEVNHWAALVSESTDLAAIVIRGRESYDELDGADRFRFDHLHFLLLNLIEGQLFRIHQTASNEDYLEWAKQNLRELIKGYFGYPGTRQVWQAARNYYRPEVQELVSESLGSDQACVSVA
jgi:hypothetical protein